MKGELRVRDPHLLYKMSVSDRRMFCLIWWLGGGVMGAEGGPVEAEWRDLEEEWLEREDEEEEPVDPELLEDNLLSFGFSLGCGCFLGMVKLDLVTLSAPVTWMGPAWKDDESFAGERLALVDFEELLLRGVSVLLDDFAFELLEEDFLSLGDTFAALVAGAFLTPLDGVADAGSGFSAGFWVSASFSFWSFSLCFSSLDGAANQQYHIKYI